MSARVRFSLLATLAGWLAATLLTLLYFELPELWTNAPPGGILSDLRAGFALWTAFTLLVSAGLWCLLILPVALAVPGEWIVRRRFRIAGCGGAGAVLLLGWRLGTWHDLIDHNDGGNPISKLFLAYTGFAFVFAWVTTIVYARLLTRIPQKDQETS
jgi:hypothetical protein